jgi:hypothetical protein
VALSWVFDLKDGMSGPAKSMVINLTLVQKATEGAKKSAQSASVSFGSLAKSMGLVAVARGALNLAEDFASAVFEANKFAERSKIAFEVLTGSASQAKETFEESRRVAIALGVPLEGVATAYRELLLGGERVENLQTVTKAASDLAALGGGSIESWAQAFADIKSKGELAGRSLMQFKGVIDFDVLARKLGFATHGFKALVTQLSAAPVSAQKGIQGLLDAIAAKQGGTLQTVSQRLANTFSGTVQSIKDELLSLFEFDSADSPVLEFLHGVRDALKPGGPLVRDIKAGAVAFMEGLGLIKGEGGFDDFVKSLKDGTVLGDHFKETMHDIGASTHYLVKALELAAKGVAAVGSAFESVGKISYAWTRGGLGSGVELTQEAREQLWEAQHPDSGLSSGMRGSIRSSMSGPSLAEELAAGIPGHAEGGIVTRPHIAMVGETGPEAIVPLSSGMRGSGLGARINLNLEQHFHVYGADGAPARELAGDLHALGVGDFQGALDTLASMMGAQ